jgi:hypothetical protein
MYVAHTVPGRYTLKPLSLVLYLEEEEEEEEDMSLVLPVLNSILPSAC